MEGVLKSLAFCDENYICQQGIHLQYQVIETDDPIICDSCWKKVYSILVIKSVSFDEREIAFVYDVSRNRRTAERIAEVLKENTVTPCTVKEILDDIM